RQQFRGRTPRLANRPAPGRPRGAARVPRSAAKCTELAGTKHASPSPTLRNGPQGAEMKTSLAFDLSKTDDENTGGEPPRKAVPVRRPCVVLAEDDLEMRMMVATTLRRAGWDVLEAGAGADRLDCVAWLPEARDDWASCVLVSDIRMPELGGLEVLARLRGLGWAGGIILITAFGDEATHTQARELGATMVLDKPFEL